MSIMHIPLMLKIIFGMISDNISIAGSKRKPYIVIMGLLQFVSLIYAFVNNSKKAGIVTSMMTLVSFSIAFQEAVVDALICLRSKVDANYGS